MGVRTPMSYWLITKNNIQLIKIIQSIKINCLLRQKDLSFLSFCFFSFFFFFLRICIIWTQITISNKHTLQTRIHCLAIAEGYMYEKKKKEVPHCTLGSMDSSVVRAPHLWWKGIHYYIICLLLLLLILLKMPTFFQALDRKTT